MRVKIVSKDGLTSVVDAETGAMVEGVTSVEFVHTSRDDIPRAVIHVIVFDADIEAEVDFARLRRF